MKPTIGFYKATAPVDASYTDSLIVQIALPRGSQDRIKRVMTGLIFVLAACGIHNAGHLEPKQALINHQEKASHV